MSPTSFAVVTFHPSTFGSWCSAVHACTCCARAFAAIWGAWWTLRPCNARQLICSCLSVHQGYGGDKTSHIYELSRGGHVMVVLPGAFALHEQHAAGVPFIGLLFPCSVLSAAS
jgi:hypothetical protein